MKLYKNVLVHKYYLRGYVGCFCNEDYFRIHLSTGSVLGTYNPSDVMMKILWGEP